MEGTERHPALHPTLPPEVFPSYITGEEGRKKWNKNQTHLLCNRLHSSPSPSHQCFLLTGFRAVPAPAPGSTALYLNYGHVPPPPQSCLLSPASQPGWWVEIGVNTNTRPCWPAGQLQVLPMPQGYASLSPALAAQKCWLGLNTASHEGHYLPVVAPGKQQCTDTLCKAPYGPLNSNEPFSQGYLVKGHAPSRTDLPGDI